MGGLISSDALQRASLPHKYASFSGRLSTPPFALDSATHFHPMGNLRKAVAVSETSEDINILADASEGTFWCGVVEDTAKLWEDAKASHLSAVLDHHDVDSDVQNAA